MGEDITSGTTSLTWLSWGIVGSGVKTLSGDFDILSSDVPPTADEVGATFLMASTSLTGDDDFWLSSTLLAAFCFLRLFFDLAKMKKIYNVSVQNNIILGCALSYKRPFTNERAIENEAQTIIFNSCFSFRKEETVFRKFQNKIRTIETYAKVHLRVTEFKNSSDGNVRLVYACVFKKRPNAQFKYYGDLTPVRKSYEAHLNITESMKLFNLTKM